MQIQFHCIYIVTILIGSRCCTEHHRLTTKQATASKKNSLLTGRNLKQDLGVDPRVNEVKGAGEGQKSTQGTLVVHINLLQK